MVNLKASNPGGRANNAVSQGGSYRKESLEFGVNCLDSINIILYPSNKTYLPRVKQRYYIECSYMTNSNSLSALFC